LFIIGFEGRVIDAVACFIIRFLNAIRCIACALKVIALFGFTFMSVHVVIIDGFIFHVSEIITTASG